MRGEIVRKASPSVGFLHRGVEKLLENKTYSQGLAYFDRLDYVSTFTQEHCYVLACEKLLKIPVSLDVQLVRVIFDEFTRLLNHLFAITTHAIDVGAVTPLVWVFEEREKILEFYERLSGARMHTAFIRIGGNRRNFCFELLRDMFNFLLQLQSRLDELEELLTDNRI